MKGEKREAMEFGFWNAESKGKEQSEKMEAEEIEGGR